MFSRIVNTPEVFKVYGCQASFRVRFWPKLAQLRSATKVADWPCYTAHGFGRLDLAHRVFTKLLAYVVSTLYASVSIML